MTTPAMEERIMELMPEDAKAALLLARELVPCQNSHTASDLASSLLLRLLFGTH
jgi:hypothetical protein